MDLSIIIVNWNSAAYLEKCLESVYGNTRGLEFEVIVVDNASFDGCGEMLARRFPRVKFIQSQANLGFAGANNLGFEHSSGRALLFLNPDTEVRGGAIATLLAALNRLDAAGAVGAKLLNSDGTIQTSCIQRFPTVLNQAIDAEILRRTLPRLSVWGMRPLLEKQAGPVAVEVISGACLMMKRGVFERVGLFTTAYFMYSEDVDLCFKAHQAGFKNYYVDDAEVVHHGGGSTEGGSQEKFAAVVMRESIATFLALRRGKAHATAYRASVVVAAVPRCAFLWGGLVSRDSQRFRAPLAKWKALLRWGIGSGGPQPAAPAERSLR